MLSVLTDKFISYKELAIDHSKELLRSFVLFANSCVDKSRDLTKTNYDLGLHHFNQGNLKDAKMRFQFVLLLTPNHPEASYQLGRCMSIEGKLEEAKKLFSKALELNPKSSNAKFRLDCLNIIDPKEIPPSTIEEDYNYFAKEYEEDYLEHLNYSAPDLIADKIVELFPDGIASEISILDIGCGTGLIGGSLDKLNVAPQITGIDISKSMLKLAESLEDEEAENIYEYIYKMDMNNLPGKIQNKFSVIASCLVFHYLKDLKTILKNCKSMLDKVGCIIFVVQKCKNKNGEMNFDTGNYTFNKDYLEKLAKSLEFGHIDVQDIEVCKDIEGYLCILRKK